METLSVQDKSTIHFHITHKCSLRCRHCSVKGGPEKSGPYMDLIRIKEVISQGIDMGVQSLEITGGDPLTLEREFLLEIVRYATEMGLKTSLLTNGQLLLEEYAQRLKKAGVNQIETSLYGTTAQVHDWFTRVSGSFDRTLMGIKFAKDAGIKVIVNTVVTRHNLKEIELLPQVLNGYDVDGIKISCIVPSGRGMKLTSIYSLNEEEMEKAIEKIEKGFSRTNYLFLNSLFPYPHLSLERYCHYFVERLAIDPAGNVIPCCLLPVDLKGPLGNVRTDRLQDICTLPNVEKKPVFYWISKGHSAMREALNYQRRSHNLCSLCIEMLYLLLCRNTDPSKRESFVL